MAESQMYEPFYDHILRIYPEFQIDRALFDPFLKLKKFKKNQYLFRQGEVCESIYFVLEGCVTIYHSASDGREERILSFHTQNQGCGDFRSFLHEQPSELSCQAVVASTVLLFDRKAKQFIEELPDGQKFLRLHAEGYASLMRDKLTDLQQYQNEERYLKFCESEPELFKRISNRLVASYLGITQQSLSRIKRRIYRRKFL